MTSCCPREEGFETLAGFVMSQLGKIPKGGERFEYDGRRYTVLQMDGHRIVRVKIESLNPPTSLERRSDPRSKRRSKPSPKGEIIRAQAVRPGLAEKQTSAVGAAQLKPPAF